MIIAGLVLTGIAALIHVYIFYMESIAWTSAAARKTFGTTEDEAAAPATKALAFNQGFYNLFLAVAVILGIIFFAIGQDSIALTLIFTGAGSMVGAALVLILSSPDKAAAALKQGVVPALGVVMLAIGVAI